MKNEGPLGREEAVQFVRQVQAAGQRVVFTNGVFDLLHVGHVRYLRQARALGDALVVGLNSDSSVRQLKGPGRPLIGQDERAELLLALQCVDAVAIFDERTAERMVQLLRPDIYAKGGDYSSKELPEARAIEAYGGQVRLLVKVEDRSTTELIEAIRQRYCP
ncbi:MAG: D-glycero-beta-D-manno-heptose 1-phosphate adenylyltransferase [Chloroflexota bacterium]